MQYIRAVVTEGGIHQAARHLNVSAPAISKAISNLESELGCLVFDRTNRTLTLSEDGRHLFRRAEELLILKETTLAELKGPTTVREVRIAGREIFHSYFGVRIRKLVANRFREACVHFLDSSGTEALSLVDQGLAHMAFTTQPPPASWQKIHAAEIKNVLCVGHGHPLYGSSKLGKQFPISEVLKYEFVSPNSPWGSSRGESLVSIDGWPDDLFPRKISSRTKSLYLFRELLASGLGIGFAPRFWIEANDLCAIFVKGGPQLKPFPVYCSAKRAEDLSWLGILMSDFSKSLN